MSSIAVGKLKKGARSHGLGSRKSGFQLRAQGEEETLTTSNHLTKVLKLGFFL